MTLEQAIRQALTERTLKSPRLSDVQRDIDRRAARRLHNMRILSLAAVAAIVITITVVSAVWLRSPQGQVGGSQTFPPVTTTELTGVWALNTVDVAAGEAATPPRKTTISFSRNNNVDYVNAQLSCNAISSPFSIIASNQLRTDRPGQSLLACNATPADQADAWLVVDRSTKAIFTDRPTMQVTATTLTIITAQSTLHYLRSK